MNKLISLDSETSHMILDSALDAHILMDREGLIVALNFDAQLAAGKSQPDALVQLKARKDQYDQKVLDSLIATESEDVKFDVKPIGVADLQDGMILVENIQSIQGDLLASKGQEVNPAMRIRFQSLIKSSPVREPFMVVLPKRASQQRPDPGEQAVSQFLQRLKAS